MRKTDITTLRSFLSSGGYLENDGKEAFISEERVFTNLSSLRHE